MKKEHEEILGTALRMNRTDELNAAAVKTESEIDASKMIQSGVTDPHRARLEAEYGKVWSTHQMREDFEVIGFGAPLVVVTRKADNKKGSLEFQAHPRFYFNFQLA